MTVDLNSANTPAPGRPSSRLASIDLLRGLIMVLMALDHARVFIVGFVPDPTNIETTTTALFTTRWVTHLCAPGFLLLAGIAALLQRERRGPLGLARLLFMRGAFLVALELTIVTFAWIPDPGRSLILLQVIWAIGWSMILLAPLVLLPAGVVGALGVALAALHPQLAGGLAALDVPGWLRILLIDANATLDWNEGTRVIVSYPILPWFAVMAAGYGLGALIRDRSRDWPSIMMRLGLLLVLGFIVLRAGGVGLDPAPWERGHEGVRAVLSFLNCEKYPPSPLFLMMTLGPLLLLLALFERRGAGRATDFLTALGRAPLFFYVLHLYALRIVGLALAAMVWGVGQLGPPPLHSAPEWPLWSAWAVWVLALIALYRPTRWFAGLKARSHGWWTSYL